LVALDDRKKGRKARKAYDGKTLVQKVWAANIGNQGKLNLYNNVQRHTLVGLYGFRTLTNELISVKSQAASWLNASHTYIEENEKNPHMTSLRIEYGCVFDGEDSSGDYMTDSQCIIGSGILTPEAPHQILGLVDPKAAIQFQTVPRKVLLRHFKSTINKLSRRKHHNGNPKTKLSAAASQEFADATNSLGIFTYAKLSSQYHKNWHNEDLFEKLTPELPEEDDEELLQGTVEETMAYVVKHGFCMSLTGKSTKEIIKVDNDLAQEAYRAMLFFDDANEPRFSPRGKDKWALHDSHGYTLGFDSDKYLLALKIVIRFRVGEAWRRIPQIVGQKGSGEDSKMYARELARIAREEAAALEDIVGEDSDVGEDMSVVGEDLSVVGEDLSVVGEDLSVVGEDVGEDEDSAFDEDEYVGEDEDSLFGENDNVASQYQAGDMLNHESSSPSQDYDMIGEDDL